MEEALEIKYEHVSVESRFRGYDQSAGRAGSRSPVYPGGRRHHAAAVERVDIDGCRMRQRLPMPVQAAGHKQPPAQGQVD